MIMSDTERLPHLIEAIWVMSKTYERCILVERTLFVENIETVTS